MTELTHIDHNNQPGMVDITDKAVTKREATAVAVIFLPAAVWQLLDGADFSSKKGPVLQTAVIAGTMAVKKTADLIPLCHPLRIDSCKFVTDIARPLLQIACTVQTTDKTGVEMEALTGASIAALTIYDMLKAVSHQIEIRTIKLQRKTGGKSDFQR